MEIAKEEKLFGNEKVWKVLLKIAPPVMLSQLIQALYNVVDSLFLGKFSDKALNALNIIYPYQYIAIALSIGIGVGVNTFMAKQFALKDEQKAIRLINLYKDIFENFYLELQPGNFKEQVQVN